MTKNQQLYTTDTITDLSHDGRGVARINGKTHFIANALPNETVEFTITKQHRNYNDALATKIITASPDRVTPPCQHFTVCGGCCLQHLQYQKQIEFKTKVLKEILQHFGEIICKKFLPPLIGPDLGYRSRARLSVKYVSKKEKMLVGFHEKNGRFVADIAQCPILHKSVGEKISALKDLIRSLTIFTKIPQIEIAATASFTAIVIRHLQELTANDQEKLLAFGKIHNFIFYLQPRSNDSVHCLTEPNLMLSYKLPEHQVELLFQPTDFTQINQFINPLMVNQALELLALQPEEKVLDLFCGLGNFTIPLAKHCAQITGVEGQQMMVARAQKNAEHNSVKNITFYSADLTSELTNQPWMNQTYDKILLDPPRTGALEICAQIKKFNAKKIVYISCNPATFARDAKELKQQGYTLKQIGFIDMFPHTNHIEIIAEFTTIFQW